MVSVFDDRISVYAKKEIKPKANEAQNVFVLKNLWGELSGQLSDVYKRQAKDIQKFADDLFKQKNEVEVSMISPDKE